MASASTDQLPPDRTDARARTWCRTAGEGLPIKLDNVDAGRRGQAVAIKTALFDSIEEGVQREIVMLRYFVQRSPHDRFQSETGSAAGNPDAARSPTPRFVQLLFCPRSHSARIAVQPMRVNPLLLKSFRNHAHRLAPLTTKSTSREPFRAPESGLPTRAPSSQSTCSATTGFF